MWYVFLKTVGELYVYLYGSRGKKCQETKEKAKGKGPKGIERNKVGLLPFLPGMKHVRGYYQSSESEEQWASFDHACAMKQML